MAEAIMAHPDLRHPFPKKPVPASGATVLYAGKAIAIETLLEEPGLWVTPDDLTRVNGFVLKPEGACFEALCLPLKKDGNLLKETDGQTWINLAAFADWLAQPYVFDAEARVWSFGEIPEKRQGMVSDAQAPEFELVDRSGKVIRMSDFKGRKALIITWSSW